MIVHYGYAVTLAAGNDGELVCGYCGQVFPQSALIVAASNQNDWFSTFSNFGACAHMIAPGELIQGASFSSNNGYFTASGTSFAAPYAAGVAAIYWQLHPNADQWEVMEGVLDSASINKISGVRNTPNRLAYTNVSTSYAFWQIVGFTPAYNVGNLHGPKPGCSFGQQYIHDPIEHLPGIIYRCH